MASVSNDPGGRKRLLFHWPPDKRHSVRLGKISDRRAAAFKLHVEHLVDCRPGKHPFGAATAAWLRELDDVKYARLAVTGIVAARQSDSFGGWLDKYLASRASVLKPEALRKLHQTRAKLLAFFRPEVRLRDITPDQAADWRQSLVRSGLSEAAVRTHCGNAKTIFADAVQRGLLDVSPMRHLRSGPTASKVNRYISPAEAAAIIEALPAGEWRLLFALARYAGLRIPSESDLLTWADVNWKAGTLHVRSPKTERHEGRESRTVPIAPELMRLLQDRYDELPEGAQLRVIPPRGSGHRREMIKAAIVRAGIAPWPKLFQTLRSSCEKEWLTAGASEVLVARVIGHSVGVSRRHYQPGELPTAGFFQSIITGSLGAAQNAAQYRAEASGNAQQSGIPVEAGIPHNSAADCNLSQVVAISSIGGGGNRTPVS